MAASVPKSAAFSVLVGVSKYRLAQFRNAPEIVREATEVGLRYWHENILPDHFKAGTQAKYGYAPRSPSYLKQKRGKPLLVWKGSLRQELQEKQSYVYSAKTAVTLKMSARVLNLAPNMPQNTTDLYVKHKNGRGYPNLKREVRVVTDEENAAIAEVIQAAIADRFGNDPTRQSRTLGTVAA